jgi:hypothetical protein
MTGINCHLPPTLSVHGNVRCNIKPFVGLDQSRWNTCKACFVCVFNLTLSLRMKQNIDLKTH